LFETVDKQYIAIGTPNDELFKRLMETIGVGHEINNPKFASYVLRKDNEKDLLEAITPAIQSKKLVDIELALMKVGVPCARMNNIKEVFEDPHIIDRKVAVDVVHPVMGKMKAVRNPVLFDDNSPSIRRHAPLLGEHSKEILLGLGKTEEEINQLAQKGVVLLG